MAQRIESFSFPPLRTGPYPLAEWMNGSTWEVVCGEEFEGTPQLMQARLHHYASTRGYRVQTRCVYAEDRQSVVFRFTPKLAPPP